MKATIIKLVLFAAIFALLFAVVSHILGVGDDKYDNRGRIRAFYKQPKDSVDVVLIGASSLYRGWSSMVAWEDFGITSWAYATSAQPVTVKNYIIEDVEERQHPDLIVLDIRNYMNVPSPDNPAVSGAIRKVVDNMPFSKNRIDAINYSLDMIGIESDHNRLEWYFSFYTFHNRWESDLSRSDFGSKLNETQGTRVGKEIFRVKPREEPIIDKDQKADLAPYIRDNLENTINYVKEHDLNVVFLALPFEVKDSEQQKLNALFAMLDDSGLPYLNLTDQADEMGIDFATDFYDRKHLNYWGMRKATDYLAAYFIAHYGLEDHRGDSEYSRWDEAEGEYQEELSRYADAQGVKLKESEEIL